MRREYLQTRPRHFDRRVACRPRARQSLAGAVVDADRGVHARDFYGITRLTGDVDGAAGGDGVALQPQQVLVAVAALQHDRERDREQHDRRRRHAGDGHDEPASHGASKR